LLNASVRPLTETTVLSPEEVLEQLIAVFPTFAKWREDEGYTSEPPTYHQIMLGFCQFFGGGVEGFTEQQLRRFAKWVNEAVLDDGPLENAVSTCFLEHTRQIKVNRVLAPYLSRVAKGKSRA
jgi:hypothetical protein